MALRRFQLDLAIPLDAEGNLPEALLAKPTTAQLNAMANMTFADIFKAMVVRLKAMSQKINPDTPSEENTIRAVNHVCRHDVGLPCDPETEII